MVDIDDEGNNTSTSPNLSQQASSSIVIWNKIQLIKQVLPSNEYEKFEFICGLMKNKLISKQSFREQCCKIVEPYQSEIKKLQRITSLNDYLIVYKQANEDQRKTLINKYPHFVQQIQSMKKNSTTTTTNRTLHTCATSVVVKRKRMEQSESSSSGASSKRPRFE
jgi:hypothetical protein